MDIALLPLVSIIIPCRNEEKYIGKCLDSIIDNDYPKDLLEVLVVDGMGEDGTRKLIEGYAKRCSFIKLLDNPQKVTPCALNLGIKNSQGELILWMSAHNKYEKMHISKCVKYLKEYNADAVGGVIKPIPRDNNLIGKAISTAISHPFGVGNSAHKTGWGNGAPQWADTAFGICYRREIFGKVGTFNENLVRGQDMEFSLRLRKAGIKTLLVPEIVSYYYARSDFASFCKHNFRNGIWAIYPFKFVKHMPISLRHLVPLIFVTGFIGSAFLSFFMTIFLWLFLIISGSYILTNFYFSSKIAAKEKDQRYLFLMPVIFASLHFTYGVGSLLGFLKVIISKQFWKNRFALKAQSC